MSVSIRHSRSANPVATWQVDPDRIRFVGADLQRPECILAERDGTLWSADARGGVMRIARDGTQRLVAQKGERDFDLSADARNSLLHGTLPNGLAFDRNGDILIANFGTDRVERMTRAGRTTVVADRLDGEPLGKVNFVLRDSRDRLWITVSTRLNPWDLAVTPAVRDGYIALLDDKGLRVVADGFQFTNEIRFDAAEEWLYVAESTGNHVSRLRVQPDGSLTDREIYGPCDLGPGLIDGFAFDSYGNLWAAMVFADRLVAITPEGDVLELLHDGDASATAAFHASFALGSPVPFDILMATGGSLCPWLASVTFGGPDLSTVYLGGLRSTRIPYFEAPVSGAPMIHWN